MRKIVIVLLLSFFIGIAANISHPVTPAYFRSLGFDGDMFGYAFSAMSFGIFLMAPFWGSLGDSKNRKSIVFISLLGYAVAQALFGTFSSALLIILVRFMAGFFMAGVNVNILAHIAEDPVYKVIKHRILSMYVSFTVMGGSLGYFIGGHLGDFFGEEHRLVIYAQALAILIVGLYVFFFLHTDRVKFEVKQRRHFIRNLIDIKQLSKSLGLFIFISMFISIAHINYSKYIDVFVIDSGHSSSALGNFVLVTGIVTLATNFFLTPFIIKRFNMISSLAFSTAFGAVFAFIAFRMDNLIIALYTVYMVFIVSKAMYEPLTVTHISEHKAFNPGMLLGIRQSAISLGAVIGPLVAGYIYQENKMLMFDIQATILLICAVLFLIYYRLLKGRG